MSKEINRRDFIKMSSVATAAIGATFAPGTLGALGTNLVSGSEKFVRSFCEMCSSRCLIEGKVVDGKNVLIQGNKYAKSTGQSVCARGGSGHSQLYDKERLVTPLIRDGKRGDGKFREASWEEAFDLIATKMSEIKQKYGPQSMIFSSKTGEHHNHCYTFASAYGSPNMFSHQSSCPITYKVAFPHTTGTELKRDFGNSKYILNFGHNLFEGIDIAMTKPLAKAAASDKTKLVVLEPRFSVVAAKADEWHPVKPGTDLAFVLALIHVWLRDDKFDKEFVEKYTIGLEELRKSVEDTTPKWQEPLTGIKAEVVEKVASELYDAAPHCMIDWGHKTTTGYAEYQRTRAIIVANILMGNVEKEGGTYFSKKASIINGLVGAKMVPEITNPNKSVKAVKTQRIDRAGEKGENLFVKASDGVLVDIPDAILNKNPYEVKGWFLIRHNPLMTVSNPVKMREAMHKLDFIVCCDVYLSECAQMADVVLPEATYLERDEGIMDKSSKSPAYAMRNKIVEPINKTLSSGIIFRTLAKKMNIDANYTWSTMNEFRVAQAQGDFELLKTLLTKGYASYDIPELLYREKKYVEKFVKKFPSSKDKLNEYNEFSIEQFIKTPSGKIEIFSQTVEDAFAGYGVPAKHSLAVANEKYPYILTNGKTAIHTNGHTQNIPFLNMLMKENPIWIHPQTAQKVGVKEGDIIYLQNDIGKEKAVAFVTQAVMPDVLFGYMGFGRESVKLSRTSGKGTNMSKLLPLEKGPICSTMITNVGVDIVKA